MDAIQKLRAALQAKNNEEKPKAEPSAEVTELRTLILGDESTSGMKGEIGEINSRIAAFKPDNKTLVLESSTPDSTKQFTIMVDDDGKLTATEVVQ